ncbi:unnamed protein product [Sympodiomycopsis kandeliae]
MVILYTLQAPLQSNANARKPAALHPELAWTGAPTEMPFRPYSSLATRLQNLDLRPCTIRYPLPSIVRTRSDRQELVEHMTRALYFAFLDHYERPAIWFGTQDDQFKWIDIDFFYTDLEVHEILAVSNRWSVDGETPFGAPRYLSRVLPRNEIAVRIFGDFGALRDKFLCDIHQLVSESLSDHNLVTEVMDVWWLYKLVADEEDNSWFSDKTHLLLKVSDRRPGHENSIINAEAMAAQWPGWLNWKPLGQDENVPLHILYPNRFDYCTQCKSDWAEYVPRRHLTRDCPRGKDLNPRYGVVLHRARGEIWEQHTRTRPYLRCGRVAEFRRRSYRVPPSGTEMRQRDFGVPDELQCEVRRDWERHTGVPVSQRCQCGKTRQRESDPGVRDGRHGSGPSVSADTSDPRVVVRIDAAINATETWNREDVQSKRPDEGRDKLENDQQTVKHRAIDASRDEAKGIVTTSAKEAPSDSAVTFKDSNAKTVGSEPILKASLEVNAEHQNVEQRREEDAKVAQLNGSRGQNGDERVDDDPEAKIVEEKQDGSRGQNGDERVDDDPEVKIIQAKQDGSRNRRDDAQAEQAIDERLAAGHQDPRLAEQTASPRDPSVGHKVPHIGTEEREAQAKKQQGSPRQDARQGQNESRRAMGQGTSDVELKAQQDQDLNSPTRDATDQQNQKAESHDCADVVEDTRLYDSEAQKPDQGNEAAELDDFISAFSSLSFDEVIAR